MAARLSTGLVAALMGMVNFRSAFTLGFLDIYSGVQPTLPDNVPNGTKLCTLYSDGVSVGLSFGLTEPDGVASIIAGQTWTGTVLATGTAGWFRLRAANDPGTVAAGPTTITAASRAANQAVIVFTANGHTNLVGDVLCSAGFTAAAYNVNNKPIVAVTTNTFSVIGESVASSGGDTASVVGTYTTSRPAADAGTANSTTALRYDGAIATSGVEMSLGNLALITGAPFVISNATFTLPQQ